MGNRFFIEEKRSPAPLATWRFSVAAELIVPFLATIDLLGLVGT